MTQPLPTEDPKLPLAPWEESSLGDDFDVSKTHGAEVFYLGDEADEHPPHPQPPDQEVEVGFPWQSGVSNQRTTSSKPLPWEVKDISSGQSYQKQPPPQVPVSLPRPSTSKSLLQPKKFTSDIWQNIPLWGYVTAAATLVLGIGVVWTANGLPKDSTGDVPQSAIVGKNSAVGAEGGTSSSSIPVRPMRSRVVPGSSSNETSKPGYLPEAAPVRPTAPSIPNERVNSSDSTSLSKTSSESSSESMYLSPLAASSAEAGAEGGPQNPFAPAYPAAKPAEVPKPTLAPPPVQPLPLPPPPKVLPAVLSLEGVAMDGKTKLAIVRVGDQPLTEEAQVGATIEGWTVTAISQETVTLRKGKQRQVLRLP